jgi:S-adenosylmethionine:tRNA ribosyltransferase-isomerase
MSERRYTLGDFNFDLPDELIAQYPADTRGESRLFVIDEQSRFKHSRFGLLGDCLRPGDLLVINNARVLPARLAFRRKTSGLVEVILARNTGPLRWLVITNRSARLREGEVLESVSRPGVTITMGEWSGDYFHAVTSEEFTEGLLAEIGEMPLPPYIRRPGSESDRERYQTVFATRPGAVAAPTAGLHFTGELIESLKERGVLFAEITLEVSWGTFSPVRDEDLSLHRMHSERYHLSDEVARLVNETRNGNGRIFAVGTTSLRVLESTFRDGINHPGDGETDIFILPPRKVESVDCLLTNFHTPGSTLLMLAAAFAGYEVIMEAYREAVRERYRFFSYGDAMLILGKSGR